VRPDQHVGWRSDTEPENPAAVIDPVRGAFNEAERNR
jgi:hypothetical protein